MITKPDLPSCRSVYFEKGNFHRHASLADKSTTTIQQTIGSRNNGVVQQCIGKSNPPLQRGTRLVTRRSAADRSGNTTIQRHASINHDMRQVWVGTRDGRGKIVDIHSQSRMKHTIPTHTNTNTILNITHHHEKIAPDAHQPTPPPIHLQLSPKLRQTTKGPYLSDHTQSCV